MINNGSLSPFFVQFCILSVLQTTQIVAQKTVDRQSYYRHLLAPRDISKAGDNLWSEGGDQFKQDPNLNRPPIVYSFLNKPPNSFLTLAQADRRLTHKPSASLL